VYSVLASVATIIITTIFSFFIYENVLLKESDQRKKYMLEALRKVNSDFKSGHEIKLKRGFIKLKNILSISGRFIKKLNSNSNFKFIFI